MNPESTPPTPGGAGPEKSLMDEPMGVLRLLANLLMIPVGLVVLVPLAVVVALWFYVAVCKEGMRVALRAVFGRRGDAGATRVLPAPHFGAMEQPTSTGDRD